MRRGASEAPAAAEEELGAVAAADESAYYTLFMDTEDASYRRLLKAHDGASTGTHTP